MAEKETGARARLKRVGAATRGRLPLAKFLESIEQRCQLSRRDRLRIVEQALLLLEMNYVHLPLKRAMHAIDPIQRLRLLKFRLMESKDESLLNGRDFHKRMVEIFASTRDLHTLYLLPAPFRDRVAFLPFLIEQYFEGSSRRNRTEKFMISRVVEEFIQHRRNGGPEVVDFEPGVEVLSWNGVPIRRAIEINGEMQAGSNPEARFARGLDNLTIRPLDTSLPPDETWVDITYLSMGGEERTLRQEWSVYNAGATAVATKATRKKRAAIDIKKTKINKLKNKLLKRKRPNTREVRVRKEFEDIFYAQIRTVRDRDFGYVRLFSFDVEDPEEFVDEFRRVLKSKTFPQDGLIIDVRGNGGGKIRAGERLMQLLTPRRVKPELFEFINTPLNLEICRQAPKGWNLNQWVDSIAESVITGATYSNGYPLNTEDDCNDIGQVYHGPVILITDALSYSTTDIFAAGFQDNQIGKVLGTSDNTGAGGANVWWYEDLMTAVGKSPDSPFKRLPRGADLLVAVRRSIRVGAKEGRPLEELGIAPDTRHYMTRRDLLKGNEDLIIRAAEILEQKPIYSISVKPFRRKEGSRGARVSASSKVPSGKKEQNISRLDVYVGGRPYNNFDAKNGLVKPKTISFRKGRGNTELLVEAFDGEGNMVAAYRHK
jgi:C-terminal processing protease CtpA/Prc